ncbi:MAG: prepilin-type N-terminal cleavage/methylation domain-containing protein [Ghiorsea sp.]|nr:prepilin-type N-terminal cleavage/methylation domain-containing protein [Ghiorsea sp.]
MGGEIIKNKENVPMEENEMIKNKENVLIEGNEMIKNKENVLGFTLLEVMVTMIIVSVGLLAMTQLLMTTMKQNSSSEARMEGAVLTKVLLTEAASSIANGQVCAKGMPVQKRDASNSARSGQTVSVDCTALGGKKYLLVATVTDTSTGKVTKNQTIYTNAVDGANNASSASSAIDNDDDDDTNAEHDTDIEDDKKAEHKKEAEHAKKVEHDKEVEHDKKVKHDKKVLNDKKVEYDSQHSNSNSSHSSNSSSNSSGH